MDCRKLGAAIAVVFCIGAPWALAVAAPSHGQQVYDAAQSAYDRSDWADAATGFATLLPATPGAPLPHAQAVIAYRYADSLMRLGKPAEAQGWIDDALPALARDPDRGLLGEALLIKGELARVDYDYVTAADAYDKASAVFGAGHVNVDVLEADIGLAEVGATLEPTRVAEVLTPLLTAPDFAKLLSRPVRAEVEDLAARAALNRGEKAAAYKLIERAVDDSGGLGSQVSVLQSYVRNDAGLIARLNNDDENVRRYFAYSGAGHMDDMGWVADHTGDMPVCSGSDGAVRPDDSVVVRFRIADDGRVADATPVYASRIGALGETFARAASQWRWDPDSLKKIHPFWRDTLELELRCVSRPQPQGFDAGSWRAALAWLDAKGLGRPGDEDAVQTGRSLFRSADDPQLQMPDAAVLAALSRPITGPEAVQSQWTRLDAIQASPAVYALMIERSAGKRKLFGATPEFGVRVAAQDYARWTAKFAQQFPDDPAVYWLTLEQAFDWEVAHDFRAAAPLLDGLISTPTSRLGADDPVRKVALLHRAIGLQRAGEEQAARESLSQSGLTADQCALFDTHPLPRNTSIGDSAFPLEALKWNFEGYVQEAFDITDDGSVAHVRTVIAYPPYIFEPTTESAVKDFKFFPPRLGGRTVGCEGQRQAVQYHIGS